MFRIVVALTLLIAATVATAAETILRVGDQKGNSQAVMEAAGLLKDVPYKIEWKEFTAAAPLLEVLGAGAIDTGLVGTRRSLSRPQPRCRSRQSRRSGNQGRGLLFSFRKNPRSGVLTTSAAR